jgi:hypothetical protein
MIKISFTFLDSNKPSSDYKQKISRKNRVNPRKIRKRLRIFFCKHDKNQLFSLFAKVPLKKKLTHQII